MGNIKTGFPVWARLKEGSQSLLRAVAKSNERLVRSQNQKFKKAKRSIRKASLHGKQAISKQGIRVLG